MVGRAPRPGAGKSVVVALKKPGGDHLRRQESAEIEQVDRHRVSSVSRAAAVNSRWSARYRDSPGALARPPHPPAARGMRRVVAARGIPRRTTNAAACSAPAAGRPTPPPGSGCGLVIDAACASRREATEPDGPGAAPRPTSPRSQSRIARRDQYTAAHPAAAARRRSPVLARIVEHEQPPVPPLSARRTAGRRPQVPDSSASGSSALGPPAPRSRPSRVARSLGTTPTIRDRTRTDADRRTQAPSASCRSRRAAQAVTSGRAFWSGSGAGASSNSSRPVKFRLRR